MRRQGASAKQSLKPSLNLTLNRQRFIHPPNPYLCAFVCIRPFAAHLSRFSRFSRLKKTPSIRVNSRPFAVPIIRASVPPCLCEKKPAAGDKVTDKARDKVASTSPVLPITVRDTSSLSQAEGHGILSEMVSFPGGWCRGKAHGMRRTREDDALSQSDLGL